MSLTNLQAHHAKTKDKPYKIFDSDGLFLYVPTSGRKVWRFKYKLNRKEKLVSIGRYSRTGSYTLKEAREIRNELRAILSQGVDPALAKVLSKNPQGKTFREAALEWIAFKSIPNTKRCWKPTHSKAVLRSLENSVFQVIGDRVISTITPVDIDIVIDPIVKRGALEVAERALSRIGAVFRYAIEISPIPLHVMYLAMRATKKSYELTTGSMMSTTMADPSTG